MKRTLIVEIAECVEELMSSVINTAYDVQFSSDAAECDRETILSQAIIALKDVQHTITEAKAAEDRLIFLVGVLQELKPEIEEDPEEET